MASDLKYDNFMVQVECQKDNNLLEFGMNFAKAIKLDVEESRTSKGLFIKQTIDGVEHIVKQPYEICSSARKINKELTYEPVGFTKLTYKNDNNSNQDNVYSKPPDIIPTGCWCESCKQAGPFGHLNNCVNPHMVNLCLTDRGLQSCYNRLQINKLQETNRDLADSFGKLMELNMDFKQFQKMYDNNTTTAKNYWKILMYNPKFTNIKYGSVHTLSGPENFFIGPIVIQYHAPITHTKSSVRIYADGKIVIITCPWSQQKLYQTVIDKINSTNVTKEVVKYDNLTVRVTNGSFRLFPVTSNKGIKLDQVYNYFNPTDEHKAPILNKGPKETIATMVGEQTIENSYTRNKNGINKDGIIYRYNIEDPKRGKMTISFVKCIFDGSTIEPSMYEITAQIYNTGIIQLIFAYDKTSTVVVSHDGTLEQQLDKQMNNIKKLFQEIKELMIYHFDQIGSGGSDGSGVYFDKETKKTSNMIYNTVPGVLPYAKKVNIRHGFLMEIYDEENEKWSGNYGYVVDQNKNKNTCNLVLSTKIESYNSPNKITIPKNNLAKIKIDDKTAYVLGKSDDNSENYDVVIGEPVEFSREMLRVHIQDHKDGKIFQGSVQVCPKTEKNGVPMQPVPYSFYGKCQGGASQYIDPIGVRSRKDQRYYPCCKDIGTDDNIKEYLVSFMMDGMSDEDIRTGNVIVGNINGVEIEDKYAGTFKPGTTDIGSTITFWDNNDWKEGHIIKSTKMHGLGNDDTYTSFDIETNDDEIVEHVRGEQFHPMHRESRNFKGLNQIVGDPEKVKDILISCAKKLNLVKTEIELEKANKNLRKEVWGKLEKIIVTKQTLTVQPKLTFSDIITKTMPFVEKYYNKFNSVAYEAVIIPDSAIRSLLFIENNEEKKYIIDSDDNVIIVDIDMPNIENCIIDGYYNNSNKSYYPIDLLYNNGTRVKDDYLGLGIDDSRLLTLHDICKNSQKTNSARSIKLMKPLGTKMGSPAYIGPIDKDISILSFVKTNLKNSDNILFIPQTGKSKYVIWTNYVRNEPIVVQLIKKIDSDNWELGMIHDDKPYTLLEYGLVATNLPNKNGEEETIKKNNYVRLTLNIMADGIINPNRPYINITKVEKDDLKDFSDTKNTIKLITNKISRDVFMDDTEWVFKNKIYTFDKDSRNPLKIVENKYLDD